MPRKLLVKLNGFWGIYEVNGDLVILPTKPPICNEIYGEELQKEVEERLKKWGYW